MTIRAIPAAKCGARPDGLKSDISPKALELWQGDIKGSSGTDNTVISIMDEIGVDPWTGQGITANRVTGALRAIGNKPVTVEINSPGGDFFEGLAIYNALREHPKDVTVKILGVAASAAAVVAMAGDTIMIPRAGFLMIHNVWVVAMGNANDLRDLADQLDPFDAVSADIFSARSGLSNKDVAKMLDAETWIGGSEAIDLGMADELLPSDQVEKVKNDMRMDAAMAARRIEEALAKGERLPRSERRKLMKEIAGTPSATGQDDMPGAVENAADYDGSTDLRFALGRLQLARA